MLREMFNRLRSWHSKHGVLVVYLVLAAVSVVGAGIMSAPKGNAAASTSSERVYVAPSRPDPSVQAAEAMALAHEIGDAAAAAAGSPDWTYRCVLVEEMSRKLARMTVVMIEMEQAGVTVPSVAEAMLEMAHEIEQAKEMCDRR
jgi:hypothetical protein